MIVVARIGLRAAIIISGTMVRGALVQMCALIIQLTIIGPACISASPASVVDSAGILLITFIDICAPIIIARVITGARIRPKTVVIAGATTLEHIRIRLGLGKLAEPGNQHTTLKKGARDFLGESSSSDALLCIVIWIFLRAVFPCHQSLRIINVKKTNVTQFHLYLLHRGGKYKSRERRVKPKMKKIGKS